MTHASPIFRLFQTAAKLSLSAAILVGWGGNLPQAIELQPVEIQVSPGSPSESWGVYSPRTLRVALEVDRDGAKVLGFTAKDVPYKKSLTEPDATDTGRSRENHVQLEVILSAEDGRRHVRHVDLAALLCLEHGADADPHVEGDTIRLHRDSIIVELPEVVDFDRIAVSRLPTHGSGDGRVLLPSERLDAARFTPAGTSLTYTGLAFAGSEEKNTSAMPGPSGVLWPESFGDSDLVQIFGDPAEGASRVNVTIVPDGYTYAEKELMETHAADMVAAFRARAPFTQHDRFINYTLVYAYSGESGTDQCDCGTIVDTAMGTRFPTGNGECGSSANRCLYYGAACDTSDTTGTTNIALAELRAPFHDEAIVMVNTPRYGGCGGLRSVYSAGNAAATEVAIHELGHSLAGLADEYAGNDSCGGNTGEINTSSDAVDGAWPEWVDELGAPVEGAQYYEQCNFRPATQCQMRSLSNEFCSVCRQHWGRVLLGHPRVRPTAPLSALVPGPQVDGFVGIPVELGVETRLPGSGAVNLIDWYVSTPPEAEPVWVSSGSPDFSHIFTSIGPHRVTVRVVADAEAIKPIRWGDNVDTAEFDVLVQEAVVPEEVSPTGSSSPVLFPGPGLMTFGEIVPGAGIHYNVYRGDVSSVQTGIYGSCVATGLATATYSADDTPPSGRLWFYLVAAANAAGEGTLGSTSVGVERAPLLYCE